MPTKAGRIFRIGYMSGLDDRSAFAWRTQLERLCSYATRCRGSPSSTGVRDFLLCVLCPRYCRCLTTVAALTTVSCLATVVASPLPLSHYCRCSLLPLSHYCCSLLSVLLSHSLPPPLSPHHPAFSSLRLLCSSNVNYSFTFSKVGPRKQQRRCAALGGMTLQTPTKVSC